MRSVTNELTLRRRNFHSCAIETKSPRRAGCSERRVKNAGLENAVERTNRICRMQPCSCNGTLSVSLWNDENRCSAKTAYVHSTRDAQGRTKMSPETVQGENLDAIRPDLLTDWSMVKWYNS